MGKFISGLLTLMVVWSCAAYRQATANVRLEHGIDDSRGPGGGFFRDGEVATGVVGLTRAQHLLILGVILTFDSHFQP